MRKHKKFIMLSSLFLGLCVIVFIVWQLLSYRSVTTLRIGQTYEADAIFKLVDNKHWVMKWDNSHYRSEEELEEERAENYPSKIYPEITYLEGTYIKKKEGYYFTITKSVLVKFKSVKAVSRKEIFKKSIDDTKETLYPDIPLLAKKKGQYVYHNQYSVLVGDKEKLKTESILIDRSKEDLPNSLSEFLKQYKMTK